MSYMNIYSGRYSYRWSRIMVLVYLYSRSVSEYGSFLSQDLFHPSGSETRGRPDNDFDPESFVLPLPRPVPVLDPPLSGQIPLSVVVGVLLMPLYPRRPTFSSVSVP